MTSSYNTPWGSVRYSKYYRHTLNNPFVFFGLPFIATIVLGSFALAPITKTRYDLHSMNKGMVDKEEQLKLKVNKRPLSLQEEYWRLQKKDLDNWENKRVERPPGVEE